MSNRLIKILTFLILFSFPFYSYADETSPEFYLSTDKSFAREEVHYVNLEGPGYSGYTLRVYEIYVFLSFNSLMLYYCAFL